MCDSEQLPDTLTAGTGTGPFSEGATLLPPIWGRLMRRRVYLQTIELRNDSYKLGRSPTCDIILNGSNISPHILKQTSKDHFVISRDKTNVPFIKDLSKNGTFLNGVIIGRGKMATLRDGDLIAVGAPPHQLYQFKDEPVNSICAEFDAKYAITRLIGKGEFGEVYLAISKKSNERFAVKKIQIGKRDESKIANEIGIMERVDHPCVIRMFESFYTSQHVYIVLEYMEGGELQSRVLRKGKLRETTAKLYVYQTAIAVEYLHNCGITHRDLKPENVLLKTRETNTILKVTDFGLSKIVGHQSAMQTLCGTPLYVAPEILKVDAYTPQVDVWSLGCITYFTLFGKTPFYPSADPEDDSLQHLYQKILKGEYTIPVKKYKTRNKVDKTTLIDETLVKKTLIDKILVDKTLVDETLVNKTTLIDESMVDEMLVDETQTDRTLVDQYQASDKAVELIRLMLETDPTMRITVDGILQHEWFQDSALDIKMAQLFPE